MEIFKIKIFKRKPVKLLKPAALKHQQIIKLNIQLPFRKFSDLHNRSMPEMGLSVNLCNLKSSDNIEELQRFFIQCDKTTKKI